MDTDLVLSHQTRLPSLLLTHSLGLHELSYFTLVTSFMLDDLQPGEWLSPHLLAGNRLVDDPKGLRSP